MPEAEYDVDGARDDRDVEDGSGDDREGDAWGSDVARRPAGDAETVRANRRWWDGAAREYQDEHGEFLGDADFVWCPEGLREADAHLLGATAGRRVLEVGCGAAQCSRWLLSAGVAYAVGSDVSAAQLSASRDIDARLGTSVPLVQCDAQRLPFADGSFDVVCSAFGGVPFVADSAAVMAAVARVLRPGGRFAFSVSHPIRWAFPDDPGPRGLTATASYFDRTPYVEQDDAGHATYVEHHRTLGDRIREIVAAGLVLVDLVEPEWPDGHEQLWGGWSPLRGRLLPGTAIFVCDKPA
jgi:SAM-dependent methyltransferase